MWWWTVWLLAADGPDRFGFSKGAGPVDLDTTSEELIWTDAADCAGCHQEAAEQWAQSRHRVSWTNDLMQAGFVAEARSFCVYCHAPAQAQVAEVMANLATYRALSPSASPVEPPAGALKPEPRAEEGISCVVCHLRDGEVLSAHPPDPESPHPIRHDPSFGTEAACVTCHQFPAPSFVDGQTHATEQIMQATESEWLRWRKETGGTEDCTDCHMPRGDHRMPGVHDHDRVRSAVAATVVRSRGGSVLRLEAQDVGHAVPTGDLFRHLTVETRRSGSDTWTPIATLGRSFEVDHSGPIPVKREVADTRLWPGQPIDLSLADLPDGGWVRLRCHLGGAHDEARGLVAHEQLIFTVHELEVRPTRR